MKNNVVKLMQGNEACVEGAIAAGMTFYGGYPITPSTEVAEGSAEKLPRVGGKFIQMEDEIAGMAATIGAALTGAKAMTATSGPGFSLKQENIGYAAMAEAPCVIVNVQRHGPSTGLPTSPSQGDVMQAKWGTHGDHPVIALSPSSVKETFDLTVRCFNLAEKYRTPVILLLDEIVGHMREKIEIPSADDIEIIDRKKPTCAPEDYLAYGVEGDELVPAMAGFGDGYRYHVTGLVHDETGFPTNSTEVAQTLITRLMDKVEKNVDDIVEYEEFMLEDAELVVLGYGGNARAVKAAVRKAREEGLKVGMFRPITIWPFPEKQVIELANKVDNIIVSELNYGQIALEVERVVKGATKVSHIGKINGEILTPDEILAKIKEVL
ncbi:2-oxoacid:acceptor oxidoreductase subunit alpha [Anaeromicrobium sediminis]|uniref:2-oxoglutarate synthase subunit alpha n=1 Tax=Anaeromicrobium sediminis TaxID=1478221 RepID=A0A267MQI9_9FIRM|nr:2-oxoacid:acceptor oxidoreductase subunit alpha [Anaeromicrobium sediminis]PAB61175.1 2-oxoglutarate synthase subunit alpha [Anaeromicrobium sediminis]